MSKDYKNIDDLFQKELGGTVRKAPAQAKVNIDKALEERNKKYRYFWLLFPIGIGILFLLNNVCKIETTGLKRELSGVEQLDKRQNFEHTLLSIPQQNKSNSLSEKEINHFKLNLSKTKKKINNPQISDSNSSDVASDKTNLLTTKNQNNNIQILLRPNISPASEKDSSHSISKVIPKVDTSSIITSDHDSTDIKSRQKVNNDSLKSADTLTSLENMKNTPDTTHLTENNPILASELNEEIDTNFQSNPDITIQTEEKKRAPWLLTLSGGFDQKWSQITASIGNDSILYDDALNDKIGYQGSININYRLKNSLTFGSGIGYSTLRENYNYYKTQTLYDTTYSWNVFLDSIPDSTGWIYFQDSTLEESINSNEIELYNSSGLNQRTYLHLPFQIGTSILFDKLRLDFYAQGRFNLLLKSSITYVENDQIVVVPKGGFKQSYFDFLIGSGIHYKLLDNFYLSGSIKYRPPISKEYYPAINNRLQNMQVGLGLSLGF